MKRVALILLMLVVSVNVCTASFFSRVKERVEESKLAEMNNTDLINKYCSLRWSHSAENPKYMNLNDQDKLASLKPEVFELESKMEQELKKRFGKVPSCSGRK